MGVDMVRTSAPHTLLSEIRPRPKPPETANYHRHYHRIKSFHVVPKTRQASVDLHHGPMLEMIAYKVHPQSNRLHERPQAACDRLGYFVQRWAGLFPGV